MSDRQPPYSNGPSEDEVRETYSDAQSRSLTEAVLDAVAKYKENDPNRSDYILFEDINPEGLNTLFKPNAASHTAVTISTDEIYIQLWCDDEVEIRVTDVNDW